MKRYLTIAAIALACASGAQASPSACKFGTFDDSSTTLDIAAMYKAADTVVVGTVAEREKGTSNIVLKKDIVLKGLAEQDIVLHGHQPQGMEVNGFVLPGNRQVLVFLKAGNAGVYDNVEEYNSACNRLWLVVDGKVILIDKDAYNEEYAVPVEKLKEYLEKAPASLVYKYK